MNAAYEGERPEVQELVPAGARRILDLGCAAGALGAALKRRGGAEVVGVELDPAYAAGLADLDDSPTVSLADVLGPATALRRRPPDRA